jgi:hypothetical protein
MTNPFDRQAQCPSCGAPMVFKFAGARAQVCKHCKFVVARTDRNLVAIGRVADLVDIPTPLQVGVTGRWGGEPFVVDGRVQLDRAGAPGAPWQEIFIAFPNSGRWCWVASAQGRWYSTSEVQAQAGVCPPIGALRPGATIHLGPYGAWQVAEVGRRRVVSGEGEMPSVAAPGVVTGYADLGGPNGAFGTIDYGDGQEPPRLYLGRQIDPAVMELDGGAPVQAAEAKSEALACPNCGGNLPIIAPGSAERIVCRYCGTASDLAQGALRALGPSPKPPHPPFVPLGAEGTLRGNRVICIGFVIRGCTVEGERYRWREYLLYAGARVGYLWLMEEEGSWQLVTPIPPGDVQVSGSAATFKGKRYSWKQSVQAQVEHVIGEFYWKVEIGESVTATEYQGPGGKVSVEQAPTEVTYSFCETLGAREIGQTFGIAPPPSSVLGGLGDSGDGDSMPSTAASSLITIVVIVFVVMLLIGMASCGSCASGGGSYGTSGGFGSPSFGGK